MFPQLCAELEMVAEAISLPGWRLGAFSVTPNCLTIGIILFLFFAGALGGALNSVAGGGSFIAFPALLFTGVPPIPANATNTIALWTGATASGGAYRKRLNVPRRMLIPLLTASLIGGLAGAYLLLKTPAHTFMRVLPWLTLGATLLFAFGRKIAGGRKSVIEHETSGIALAGATLFQLCVAVYGGYFGGGMGIVTLAMLAVLGMTDIHSMNALKSVMGSVINGVAVITFIVARAVYWKHGGIMIVGAIAGGYLGAHYAMKLPQAWVRWFVVLVGTGMTVYFFWKSY
ncbi:MAG TPA: sulfite exporter TauE/SafE family protein [Candidatus Sulfotelmatobacter sp.]|nr:sulfite exporter TauE/SafE family protein [Candidatus Sulfotelmatobacter sp.]